MMISDPLFSVILPAYGRPRFLHVAVTSVLEQTVGDFELIVIDDASPTPLQLSVSDSRIRMIRRTENGGPPAARNTGMEEARGRFITFIDDDDWFLPERLAFAEEGLGDAPITVCWRDNSQGRPAPHRVLQGMVEDQILDGPPPHLGVTTIDRRIAPRFDERFIATQDVEWWLRAAHCGPLSTVPRVGYVKRIHDGERHGNGAPAHLRAGLLLLETHAEYFKAHPSAAARRWLHVWQTAYGLGEYAIARRAAMHSIKLDPQLRTAWRLLRSFRRTPPTLEGDAVGGGRDARTPA